MYSYKTKGVCSREIQFDVENDIIKEVRFIGGCMGNTQGVAALAKGRNIGIMKFICGFNPSTTMFYNLDSVPVFGSTTSEMVDENPF